MSVSSHPWARAVASRPRVAVALVLGLLTALSILARTLHEPNYPTDLDQLHFAARALLRGENPYTGIGPDRAFDWDWPLFYPLPTVLLTVPLALFPVQVARVVFGGLGGALFGYAISRDGLWRLPACLSAAFLITVWRSQWSLLVTAAFFVPVAAVFLAAKPNLAVAFLAGLRSKRAFMWFAVAAVGLTLIGLAVEPEWIADWITALRTKEYVSAPVMNPGGFLLLLALAKWRLPEARIFAALVCVPQTPSVYDLMPLFVVPRTFREVCVLSLLTSVLFGFVVVAGPFSSFNDYAHFLERAAVFVVYLPALIMLLRRPNVAPAASEDARSSPVSQPATPRGLRARIEALPRLDALLLLANGVCATLLIWGTLVTRRV